jgi:hypothetical protein
VKAVSLVPLGVWHGSTEWHPGPQWLLRAIDEQGRTRDFALCNFLGPPP